MVISVSGFDMTKEFRKTIYGLLEQSKRDKELNKVKKSKPSTPNMDTKSLFRYKNVGGDKYKYDIGDYEDFENMMDEDKVIKKPSLKQILHDVVMGLNDEKERDIRKDYFDYDRADFIKSILKRDGISMDEAYSTSVQTIVTEIFQILNDGYITYYDDEGNNLNKHYRIEENGL